MQCGRKQAITRGLVCVRCHRTRQRDSVKNQDGNSDFFFSSHTNTWHSIKVTVTGHMATEKECYCTEVQSFVEDIQMERQQGAVCVQNTANREGVAMGTAVMRSSTDLLLTGQCRGRDRLLWSRPAGPVHPPQVCLPIPARGRHGGRSLSL